jgi:hypothetical protein
MTTLLAPSSQLTCPPRWATPRNFGRPTLGPRVGEVAALLGTPFMPWQQQVADVALEVDPDSGLLAYREIVVTVPRQSGKTTAMLTVMVHRARAWPRSRILYTAQTRNHARQKWEDEHVAVLERSPLRKQFRVRRSNGSEAIRWHNGSMHGISSLTEKAGHGDVLDLGVVDEAFAHDDARADQNLKPTMITRPQPQLWVVSTAGTPKSVYLRGKVEAGRLRCDHGAASSVAYFEWSAPNDADPGDPVTWRAMMPALGHTIDEPRIRQEFEGMELAEFRRAYLNQWNSEIPAEWLVVGQKAWAALEDARSQAENPVAFAVDATPDRTWASVAAAGRRADGLLHVEVVKHQRGTDWVVPWLAERVPRWNPCAVVLASRGPASSLVPEFDAAGIELLKLSAGQVAQACGFFYDAAGANPEVDRPAWLRHLGQPELTTALAGAMALPVGDMWVWARKGLSVVISPLYAATLALWGVQTAKAPLRPMLVVSNPNR